MCSTYFNYKICSESVADRGVGGGGGGGGGGAQRARAPPPPPPLVSNVNKCEDRGAPF